MGSGKQPYFLKAADKKKLELLAKYQELKVGGGGGGGRGGRKAREEGGVCVLGDGG